MFIIIAESKVDNNIIIYRILKLDKCKIEYIKRQIYALKEIKQRAEKYKNKEDIRGYFSKK